MPSNLSLYKKLKNFLFGNMPVKEVQPETEIKQCQNCKVMSMFIKVTEKKLLKGSDEPTEAVKAPEDHPRYANI